MSFHLQFCVQIYQLQLTRQCLRVDVGLKTIGCTPVTLAFLCWDQTLKLVRTMESGTTISQYALEVCDCLHTLQRATHYTTYIVNS